MKKEYLFIVGAVVVGLIVYFMWVQKALNIGSYEEGYDRV